MVEWTQSPTVEFAESWNISWGPPDSDDPITSTISSQRGGPAPPREEDRVRSTVAIVYFFTSIFGVVGNTLVVVVILRFPKIRNKSVSNYYILNLAVADELHLLTLPFFCHATFANDWIFGDTVCRLAHVLRECNKFASVFTLAALSIDRFLATYHQLGHLRRIGVGVTVCFVIWVVCLAGCAPYLVHCRVQVREAGRRSCQFQWSVLQSVPARRLWIYMQLVFGLAVPFAMIASFNVLLLRRLRSITLRRSSMDRSSVQSRNHSGMARLVIVIVCIFMVSHLPYHVIEVIALKTYEQFVLMRKVPSAQYREVFIYVNVLAQVLVYLSSCSNPIVYGVINKNYSKNQRRNFFGREIASLL